jgi:hypothetical protein
MITNEDILPFGANKLKQLCNIKRHLYVCSNVHGDFDGLEAAMRAADFEAGRGDILLSMGDLFGNKGGNAQLLSLFKANWFHAILGVEECWMIAGISAYKAQDDQEMLDAYQERHGEWLSNYPHNSLALNSFYKKLTSTPLACLAQIKAISYGFIYGGVSLADWKSFQFVSAEKLAKDSLFNPLISKASAITPIKNIDYVYFNHPELSAPTVSFNSLLLPTNCNDLQFNLVDGPISFMANRAQ